MNAPQTTPAPLKREVDDVSEPVAPGLTRVRLRAIGRSGGMYIRASCRMFVDADRVYDVTRGELEILQNDEADRAPTPGVRNLHSNDFPTKRFTLEVLS